MGLLKALEKLRSFQQNFEVTFPDLHGDYYTGTFRVMMAKDANWVYDVPMPLDVQLNRWLLESRQFICSLVSFQEEDSQMLPWELVPLLTDRTPISLLATPLNSPQEIQFSEEIWKVVTACKSYDEFMELPINHRHLAWEILLAAFNDGLQFNHFRLMVQEFIGRLKTLQPNLIVMQFEEAIKNIPEPPASEPPAAASETEGSEPPLE